jgi:signal transduction histidine kinase
VPPLYDDHVEGLSSALRADYCRELLEAVDQGFCTIEVLLDDDGRPADYRFLHVNAAFEAQTGLRDAVGKRMRELAPTHEEHWFQIYGHVALTGVAARFEQQAAALGRWFDVYAFRVGEAQARHVALLFSDITTRRRAELDLQEARRQAESANRAKDDFLAMLSHELRNPLAQIVTALQLLRLHVRCWRPRRPRARSGHRPQHRRRARRHGAGGEPPERRQHVHRGAARGRPLTAGGPLRAQRDTSTVGRSRPTLRPSRTRSTG